MGSAYKVQAVDVHKLKEKINVLLCVLILQYLYFDIFIVADLNKQASLFLSNELQIGQKHLKTCIYNNKDMLLKLET